VNLKARGHFVKQENESATIPSEKTPDSNTAERHREVTPIAQAKSDDVTINFHSAEFNRIDDLNDCARNYRSFQPLDGVVTAHERHQIELCRKKDTLDSSRDGPACPRRSEVETDDAEALEAAAPLTVISEGRTLIIDTDEERAMACGKTLRNHRLSCTLIVTGRTFPNTSASRLGRVKLLHAERVSVTGAFGGFSAKVIVGGSEKPLAEWFEDGAIFDLVLDLQPVTSFAGGRLPIGYYAPGPSPAALDEAMAELPEMRGRFKKPQFTSFQEKRCLHGRSRTRDCRQCLDICPFGAIQSVNRKISVNHYLCQGCGGCSMVCPSDAIRLLEPSREGMLKALKGSLNHRPAGTDTPAILLISDMKIAGGDERPEVGERINDLPVHFVVEQIGHVGLDVILSAFVYSARRVVVACRTQNPPGIRKAVERQIQIAGAILKGLGLPEDSARFTVFEEDIDSEKAALATVGIGAHADSAFVPAALFPPVQDQRTRVRLAAQVLYNGSGVNEPRLPLPAGSPFGAVAVDTAACTLCKACATVCPSGALSGSGDVPRLTFLESHCHQCGLCEEACPEGAIRMLPRLFCDLGAIEAPVVLHEAEPFRCVACGAPFASPAMITRMENKLKGHWMYANERQLRRLRMCRTCRTLDALTSKDVTLWNR
jgi:ferredoxin